MSQPSQVSITTFGCRRSNAHRKAGFTLAEVLVAITVAALFGLAAFATNARLVAALRAQRETTAASLMLQERMETLRSLTYPHTADATYIGTNVINTPTNSEAPLGNLSETITISGYMDSNGNVPPTVAAQNSWTRNASYPSGNPAAGNSTISTTNYVLIKADILITWTSANGRTRTRELATIFSLGNS